jgi:hypothetical protein
LCGANGNRVVHSRADESLKRLTMQAPGSTWANVEVFRRNMGRMYPPRDQVADDVGVDAVGNHEVRL